MLGYAILALLGLALVVIALVELPQPEISEEQAAAAISDLPQRVVRAATDCAETYTTNCTAPIPVAHSSTWRGEIEFESITSTQGKWDTWDARLALGESGISSSTEGTHYDDWGDEISELGTEVTQQDFTPTFKAELRQVPRRLLHKRIDGKATITFDRPALQLGGATFTNVRASRTRQADFFVVSDKEAMVLFDRIPSSWTLGRAVFLVGFLGLILGAVRFAMVAAEGEGAVYTPAAIRWAIMDHPGLTASEIADRTGIPMTTVNATLAQMAEGGGVAKRKRSDGNIEYKLRGWSE